MSRISEALANKNRVERSQRARRRDELASLRSKSAFKASLSDELRHIETLLDSHEIDAVVIKVPEKLMPQFGEAIYSEELFGYDISQVPNTPDQFCIRLKMI